MTSKLTRERIELIANFHRAMALPPSHAEIEELARMALATMDSEPVAEITEDLGRLFVKIHYPTTLRAGDKLYRHAQPVPVVSSEPVAWIWQHLDQFNVTIYDERARDLALGGVNVEPLYRHAQPAPVVPELRMDWQENEFSAGWNACRAAMLAAAPQEGK